MWVEAYTLFDGKLELLDLKFSNHRVLECKQFPIHLIRYRFLFAGTVPSPVAKTASIPKEVTVGELQLTNNDQIAKTFFEKIYFINGENKNIIQTESHTRDIMPRTIREFRTMVTGMIAFILRYDTVADDWLIAECRLTNQTVDKNSKEMLFYGCETIEDICQQRDFILL